MTKREVPGAVDDQGVLAAQCLVLTPVCFGLLTDAGWIDEAYGGVTAARGILLSVYLSIALVSVILLFVSETTAVGALLLVQVVYKVTTPVTVGTFYNPVVLSNMVIAAVHMVTLVLILRASR